MTTTIWTGIVAIVLAFSAKCMSTSNRQRFDDNRGEVFSIGTYEWATKAYVAPTKDKQKCFLSKCPYREHMSVRPPSIDGFFFVFLDAAMGMAVPFASESLLIRFSGLLCLCN